MAATVFPTSAEDGRPSPHLVQASTQDVATFQQEIRKPAQIKGVEVEDLPVLRFAVVAGAVQCQGEEAGEEEEAQL